MSNLLLFKILCRGVRSLSIFNKLKSFADMHLNNTGFDKIELVNNPVTVVKSKKTLKQNICKVLNAVAPIVAVTGFVMTVNYWSNLNYGIALSYDGVELGTVESENVYDKATDLMNERISTNGVNITPTYSLAIIDDSKLTDSNELCNNLISAYDGIENATGFYLDGKLLCVADSEDTVNAVINEILDNAKAEYENATAELVNEYGFENGLYNKESILTKDEIKSLLLSNVTDLRYYTVKDGDTLESIAQSNNLSISDLLNINTDINVSDILKEGTNVVISVEEKRLSIKVSVEKTYNVVMPYKTVTQYDNTKFEDYSAVTQEGSVGNTSKTDVITYIDGVETERENIKSEVTADAVDKIITVGTLERTYGVASGSFIWPVPSTKYISSGYGYRWGTTHKGIDIAGVNIYGSDIVAADGGTVVYVKLHNYGYGYHLLIDHGNGYQTLYAHCSAISVEAGQQVYAGQKIASVGSTGDSTGPHLHFEILCNGSAVNPIDYVS